MDVSGETRVEDKKDFYQTCALIFLVDFRESMFKERDDGETYFKKCIECYKSVMISLARKEKRNCATSVILMGTNTSNNYSIPTHIGELQPLDVVSAERIIEVNDMLAGNFSSVISKFGHYNTFRLSAAMHYCQVAFKKWKSSEYNKSVIIFTDDDNPYGSDPVEAHKALKQADDLFLLNIDLNIVPFGNFDGKKFYNELIALVKGEEITFSQDNEQNITLADLINTVERIVGKFSCHRRKLHLGKARSIPILLYKPYVEPTVLLKKHNVQSEGGITQELEAYNDEIYENHEMPQFPAGKTTLYPFIGRLLQMSKEEISQKCAKTDVGFRLIGFYPTGEISEYLSIAPPYLMLPDNKDINGASLWAYLLDRCMERELSMICWYMFHKNCPPTLVTLTPYSGNETGDEMAVPPGFIVSTLPCSDELHELDEDVHQCDPSEEQIKAANEIVKKLTFGYSPAKFHDFHHRKFVAMIEALALSYDNVEEFDDDTDIDLESITTRLGHLSQEFSYCGGESSSQEIKKRKGDEENSRRLKVPKPELDHVELVKMVQDGKAHQLTVAQLRNLLQWEGIKSLSTYTKPKLVELVNFKCKYSQQS